MLIEHIQRDGSAERSFRHAEVIGIMVSEVHERPCGDASGIPQAEAGPLPFSLGERMSGGIRWVGFSEAKV
jgi:hypothetical protein